MRSVEVGRGALRGAFDAEKYVAGARGMMRGAVVTVRVVFARGPVQQPVDGGSRGVSATTLLTARRASGCTHELGATRRGCRDAAAPR
jgi:hypothetical protein